MKKESIERWQLKILVLCWVAYAAIYLGRVNLSVAIPYIQKAMELDKVQLGFIGSLFFWVYGIGQLMNGFIGDRVCSRTFIFIGLLAAGLSNILFGLSSNYVFMLIFWAVNGYFQSMLWGPIAKTLSYWYPYEKMSRIAIVISTSSVSGFILSWGLTGQILSRMSWRWAFLIPGIFILLYSIVWYSRFKSRPEDIGLKSPNILVNSRKVFYKDSEHSFKSLWNIINESKLWYIVIACFSQGIIKEGINLWAPSFIMETQNLDIKSVSSFIVFIPVMNFVGMMLSGWLNKKLKYQEKLTTIIFFGAGMMMILGLLKFNRFGMYTALIYLGLSSAAMYGINTMLLGVIPMNFAKYNKVSSVAGFLDFCSYLASGFSAFFTGIIVKHYGWFSIIVIWLAVACIGMIVLIISWKTDKDHTTMNIEENTSV